MSDADIVSVFSRKMGAVERLIQRTHADAQVPGGSDMKELHARIADLATQIKRERYIEQLEAIESSTRSPLKVCPSHSTFACPPHSHRFHRLYRLIA
jgi:hypothetical protein